MHLFIRNNPEIIADAEVLTYEAFLAKYRGITTEMILSGAYRDIRKELGLYTATAAVLLPDGKSVTFKVIARKKDQVDPKPDMRVVKDEEEQQPGNI